MTELKFQQITAGNLWVLLASFITKFPPLSHISSDLKILDNCPSLQQRHTHTHSLLPTLDVFPVSLAGKYKGIKVFP